MWLCNWRIEYFELLPDLNLEVEKSKKGQDTFSRLFWPPEPQIGPITTKIYAEVELFYSCVGWLLKFVMIFVTVSRESKLLHEAKSNFWLPSLGGPGFTLSQVAKPKRIQKCRKTTVIEWFVYNQYLHVQG